MKIVNKLLRKIAQYRPIKLTSIYEEAGTQFSGKNVLVVGGGTGIGRSIVHELSNCGARVIVCSRTLHGFEWAKNINCEMLDVSRITELEKNLSGIVSKYTKIDMVVNSQGICPEMDFKQKFYGINQEDFETVIRINLETVFFVNQYFCHYFEKNGIKGNILNICSTEGLKGNVVPYGLSKAAVISLTKGLGKEMASKNIVVNGIAPGATATELMKMDCNDDLRMNYIPSQRACVPTEIAQIARLLLSDAGRQMCGEVIVIDGGESLK